MAVVMIGGASSAGKSTAAERLATALQLPLVALDRVNALLRPVLPDRARQTPPSHRLGRAVVSELLMAGADCIVEGGWLLPDDAAKLRRAGLIVIYCGFTRTTASERLRVLRAGPVEHWIVQKSEEEALEWLEQQILSSRRLREKCQRLGMTYVDCSDIEQGVREVCRIVTSLVRPGRSA